MSTHLRCRIWSSVAGGKGNQKAPEGYSRSLERPGSLQYQPRPLRLPATARRGTGVRVRLLCGPSRRPAGSVWAPTLTDVNTIVRPLLCGVRGFGGRSGCSLVWRTARV